MDNEEAAIQNHSYPAYTRPVQKVSRLKTALIKIELKNE